MVAYWIGEHSITDPAAYARAVEETASRGAALDVDEYVDGMRAAAAPVVGQSRQLAAVIWIAGFARHIDEGLRAAQASLDYLREFACNVPAEAVVTGDSDFAAGFRDQFVEALNDDLNTPRALAAARDRRPTLIR